MFFLFNVIFIYILREVIGYFYYLLIYIGRECDEKFCKEGIDFMCISFS